MGGGESENCGTGQWAALQAISLCHKRLKKERDVLLAFYDFPAEHWVHMRTTNPIESTFGTVRQRNRRAKGNHSRVACLAIVSKLCESAAKHQRLLNGATLLPNLASGVVFINGEKAERSAA